MTELLTLSRLRLSLSPGILVRRLPAGGLLSPLDDLGSLNFSHFLLPPAATDAALMATEPSSQVSQHSFRLCSTRASYAGMMLFPALSLKFAFKSRVPTHGSASHVFGTKNLINDTVYLLCS